MGRPTTLARPSVRLDNAIPSIHVDSKHATTVNAWRLLIFPDEAQYSICCKILLVTPTLGPRTNVSYSLLRSQIICLPLWGVSREHANAKYLASQPSTQLYRIATVKWSGRNANDGD